DELRRVGLGALLRDNDWKPAGAQLNGGPKGIRGLCISWEPEHATRPGVLAPRYEFDAALDTAIEAPFESIRLAPRGESNTPNESGRLAERDGYVSRFWLLTES